MKVSLNFSFAIFFIAVLLLWSTTADQENSFLSDSEEQFLSNRRAPEFRRAPVRRHHLRFGLLGKRANNFDFRTKSWLNDWRERRASTRPLYGLLG